MYCPRQITYVIRPRDTIYHLARQFHTTVESIIAFNPHVDPYNLQIGSALAICPGETYFIRPPIAVLPPVAPPIGVVPPVMPPEPEPPPVEPCAPMPCDCSANLELNDAMRFVWMQHIYWTRLLLVDIAARLKSQNATEMRLMDNPCDIAAVYKNFYSERDAKKIEDEIREHLKIGGALITALRDRRMSEAEDLNRKWYKNADEMAGVFSQLNPYYRYEDVRDMLKEHLDLTGKEVTAHLKQDYNAGIEAFGEAERAAMKMADYFTSGLVSQFKL